MALRRLEVEHQEEFIDIFNPPGEFLKKQPAATIPVLETKDGQIIPDSSLILDYLHESSKKKLWGSNSLSEKIASTWCEAMMTNAVSYFLETQKTHPDSETLEECKNNVERLIDHCARMPKDVFFQNETLTQSGWDYAVAIEYVRFRMLESGYNRKNENEKILELARMSESFKLTQPRPN